MSPDNPWQDPPESLDAPTGVDVWRCPLAREEEEWRECNRLLDPAERARAERFVFDGDRRRWTVARGMLRLILSRYVRRPPEDLIFDVNAAGKPSLRDAGLPPISFNLSHSGPMAIVAVTAGRPVGIDVEELRTDVSAAQITARYFSPREHAALSALPAALLPAAFFSCWTRKEAVVKALGRGLSFPLEALEVGLDSGSPVQVPGESPIQLRALPVGPGYASTVAAAGGVDPLRLWRR